jgi:hypothetical protein
MFLIFHPDRDFSRILPSQYSLIGSIPLMCEIIGGVGSIVIMLRRRESSIHKYDLIRQKCFDDPFPHLISSIFHLSSLISFFQNTEVMAATSLYQS